MYALKICFCLLLLLSACTQKKEITTECVPPEVTTLAYPVHIPKEGPATREIDIHEIANVSYIKLDTNSDCFLPRKWRFSGIYLTEKDLFISFGSHILRFDRNGHFLNNIGSVGGAPFEFAGGGFFSVNESREEIFLLDFVKQRMLVYNYAGKYLRSFKNEVYFDRFCVINDSLAVCCNNNITMEDRAFLLSLKNGKKKEVLLGKRKVDPQHLMVNIGAFSRINKYEDLIFLCMATSDTIYAYHTTEKKLTPVYIQHPLIKNDDRIKTVPYLQFETSQYASILINDTPLPDFTYWLNKEDGTIAKIRLKNKEAGDYVPGWGTNRPDVLFDLLEMPKLKELQQKNALSGELETVVAASGEEDNPILMIATLRDR